MSTMSPRQHDDEFVPPGVVAVSRAALQLARDLAQTIGNTQRGDWVVVFDWATSVSIRRGPEQPSESVDDCVMAGASERNDLPPGVTQTVDGVEFAIQIPRRIWELASERLIDVDEGLLFKLVLR